MGRGAEASCTLLVGGDVAPIRKEGRGMFGAVAPLFQEADLAFANLEHSLSRKGRLMAGKPFFHRGGPESVEGLAEARFDALAVANNHILDYGEEALFDTLGRLEARSLPYTGAGKNLAEARKPVILERRRLRVGILAYSSTLPQGFAEIAIGPADATLPAGTHLLGARQRLAVEIEILRHERLRHQRR